MSKINCDTVGLKDLSNEFNYLVTQYNEEIINIYELISSITTNAWSGKDAKLYVSSRLKQKQEFEKLGEELISFSQKLENCQNTLENNIEQIRR